jgi:Prokaryotic homologs of the JAB domain
MTASAEDESLLRRPPAPRPYTLPNVVLSVPRVAIELTLHVFQPYLKAQLEACCFWYGDAADTDNGEVRAVVVPRQLNHWGCYRVQADAMARISTATRTSRWCNLAQIHTHPGASVEHSRYDDSCANSRRALSFVFPFYGKWQGKWPEGVGVHEFQIDYWHYLSRENAARRVILIEAPSVQLIDVR